jgi:hypothetical protein
VLSAQPKRVDFDSDLEQQQDDAHIRQHLQLIPIGDIARREGRDDQPGPEIAEHRREAKAPRNPPGGNGEQQDEPDLEYRGRLSREEPTRPATQSNDEGWIRPLTLRPSSV